jgi:hypothetical protein
VECCGKYETSGNESLTNFMFNCNCLANVLSCQLDLSFDSVVGEAVIG